MRIRSFEKLEPIEIGENLLPPDEFARICPVCVRGSKRNVLTKVEIARLQRESPEGLQSLRDFMEAFQGNQPFAAKEKEQPQEPEDLELKAFLSGYKDEAVGRLIYYGKAKTSEEAREIIENDRQLIAQQKAAKEQKQKISILSYPQKPVKVEINREATVYEATNGRTFNWDEMTEKERKIALKNRQFMELSLEEYIKICPDIFRPPTQEEVENYKRAQGK